MFISGPTSRTGRISTWLPGKERVGAAEIDGEAALYAPNQRAHDGFAGGEILLKPGPGFFAASLLAADTTASPRAFSMRSR